MDEGRKCGQKLGSGRRQPNVYKGTGGNTLSIGIENRNLKLYFHSMYGILVLFSILHFEGVLVAICYSLLWKQLIARDIQKKDLRIAAGLSTNVIAKLGKNQNASTEVSGKIRKVLNCEITDTNSKQREIREVLK